DDAIAGADVKSNGIGGVHALMVTALDVFIRRVVVDESPSAASNAVEWSTRRHLINARSQERLPVVRRHLVQRRDDVVEGIRLDSGRAALAAMEDVAEVLDGFLGVRELADGSVDVEPNQPAFVIKVDAAAVSGPLSRREVEQ